MRRVITKEEKKILDKCSSYVTTGPVSGTVGFSFVALSIGCTVGAIIGAIWGFGILGQHHPLSMVAFFVPFLLGTVLAPLLTNIIGNKIRRNKLFVVGKTKINGATCTDDILSGAYTTYAEDDYLDENGRPYKMMWPGSLLPPRKGTRYVLVENDGLIFLMYRDKELKSLVPEKAPQEADGECQIIGHQKQVENTKIKQADQRRIELFFNHYKNTCRYRKSLCMLGTGFFGFLGWTFIIFATYGMFFDGTSYEDSYFPIALPLLFVLTGVSLGVCSYLFHRSNHKKYRNIKSVEKVILVVTNPYLDNSGRRAFQVTETDENGQSVTKVYDAITGFDCGDAAKMRPGQTIFKYTYDCGEVFFGTK